MKNLALFLVLFVTFTACQKSDDVLIAPTGDWEVETIEAAPLEDPLSSTSVEGVVDGCQCTIESNGSAVLNIAWGDSVQYAWVHPMTQMRVIPIDTSWTVVDLGTELTFTDCPVEILNMDTTGNQVDILFHLPYCTTILDEWRL